MRQPCFLKIWRDCAANLGYYQFSDGSIYQYSNAAAAAAARLAMINDPHGTEFNHDIRIANGQPGYTKLSSAPSAELIYTYPPYDSDDPGPCLICAGFNTDATALTWGASENEGGTVTVSGSGQSVSFVATFVADPLVQMNSLDWCVEVSTNITITVTNTSGLNGISVTVTNSAGDFNYTVVLNSLEADTRTVAWGPGVRFFQASWQRSFAGAMTGSLSFTF